MPLPDEQVLTRLVPVRDGVLWATTLGFPASAAVSGGQLHRSADNGETWNRVLADTS